MFSGLLHPAAGNLVLAAATSRGREYAAQDLPSGCRLAGGGSSRLEQPSHEGWPGCAHLHQAEVSSHAGYLFNQHVSMLGVPLDCNTVACEPSSRQQKPTIVQLISKSHHHHHLRSICVSTPTQSHRYARRACAKLPTGVPFGESPRP